MVVWNSSMRLAENLRRTIMSIFSNMGPIMKSDSQDSTKPVVSKTSDTV
jgi:hypothetical protein